MFGTIGWIADALGLALCGAYRGMTGSRSQLCLVDAGHPLLGIVAVVLFGAFLAFLAWRSIRT